MALKPGTGPGARAVRCGPWPFLLVILVLLFRKIEHHYADASAQLRVPERARIPQVTNTVIVLVPSLHIGVLHALQYARLLSPDCRAVHIEIDPQHTPELQREWQKLPHSLQF